MKQLRAHPWESLDENIKVGDEIEGKVVVVADYGGGYAGSGFRYGSNAREFSLAGALIADKTPGFQAFSNPALLQFTRSNQVGVSFQHMSLDRSIQSFSFARRLPPNAGIGLALLMLLNLVKYGI